MNAPLTHEGWAIWDLASSLSGHLTYAGMAGVPVGINAQTLLAVAHARGLNTALVAEMLPAIDAAVIGAIRESRGNDG